MMRGIFILRRVLTGWQIVRKQAFLNLKKLWTGIDAIWDNPYFVITKVCIILENGWKIQHRPWDDFLQ